MVNRVKTWTPVSLPFRDNLPVWKAICNDICDHMVLAGLVQTLDSGQLDINAVSALPADTDPHIGYRMYRFNDPMQSQYPILIKLEFGCGPESLNPTAANIRGRVPNIKITVGTNTDGIGNFVGLITFERYCPQNRIGVVGTSTSTNSGAIGTSYICYNEDKGFFGFVYGAGSRGRISMLAGGYVGASLTLFIQRTLDANGVPDNRGFSLIAPTLSSTSTANLWTATTAYANTSVQNVTSSPVASLAMMPLIGVAGSRAFGSEVGMQPVYMETPYIQSWPSLLTYHYTDIVDNTLLTLNFNGPTNFKTLGREISIVADTRNYWYSGLAMLYEGDVIP